MKDPENSRDEKNADAGDMSLADLLGADVTAESSSARRVEARADEPDSGMVNLARMVAGSSVETAKTPSIAPPPAPDREVRDPTDGQGVIAPPGAAVSAPEKKSNAAIWVLVVAVVVVGVVGIVVFSQSRDEPGGETRDDEMAQALLARMEEQQRAAEERIAALMARLEESKTDEGEVDEAAKAALEKEIEEAKAAQEEAAKQADEAAAKVAEAKTAAEKPAAKVAEAAPRKPAATTPRPDPAPTKKPAVAPKPAETKPAAGGASELDSLLGPSKKDEPQKKPAAPADTTPSQLSRTDIQQAMAPVAQRAQARCAQYSTGSVQVRVVVANTGRVQNSEAVGTFANSTAGNCVAMLVRTAKFPKFKDATQTFTYPIVLK